MNPHDDIAYRDPRFLASEEGRPIGILAEYLRPLRTVRHAGIEDTIVFFGSARLSPDGPLGRYYEDAKELAKRVTEWSHSLPCESQRFVVCLGGGDGVMEAANRSAAEAGGRSIGLNISFPHEQRPNRYISPELQIVRSRADKSHRYAALRSLTWMTSTTRASSRNSQITR